jgi:hypothetical protein
MIDLASRSTRRRILDSLNAVRRSASRDPEVSGRGA